MYKKRIFSHKKKYNMISLIKSGIVCLVSIFYLKYDSLAKLDVIETTYLFKPINAKISTERNYCVVVHMFINKTKCNRKICITYSKQLVQTCISTEKKVCLVHFFLYCYMLRKDE